jgi:DtxR family Mn-dependent transcriptional regulator
MLSEIFGMEWYEIHEEAERLEHAVSPAFESKLQREAGRRRRLSRTEMRCCRMSPAERKERGETPLSEALEGEIYTVTSLQERDPKLLLFLHQTGIGPGQVVSRG